MAVKCSCFRFIVSRNLGTHWRMSLSYEIQNRTFSSKECWFIRSFQTTPFALLIRVARRWAWGIGWIMDTKRGGRNTMRKKNGKILLYSLLPADFRYGTAGSTQASLVCSSGKNNIYMKMSLDHWWNDIDRERRNARTKTRISATLFTTIATWTDLGSKAKLLVGSSANDSQSHGAATEKKVTWAIFKDSVRTAQ